jgi:hypothetical protein
MMPSQASQLYDAPPQSDTITDYDRSNFTAYLLLLDCAAAGGDWREAMVQLIGDGVDADPVRARRIYDTHLARARWMTETGYRLLLRDR